MSRRAVCLAGISLFLTGPLYAQEKPPAAEDLILRPGDTITWLPSAPHRVRFGGTVQTKSGPVTLTPFEDIKNLLDISPTLSPEPKADFVRAAPGAQVKGKVKAGADKSKVPE